MDQQDRDLLIRLDQKVDDIRTDMGQMKINEKAQWEKIDKQAEETADQRGSLRWLTWAVRSILAAVIAIVGWVFKSQ